MLIYAGIDEAGYGPMFGPLCVASTAFVLEDCNPEDGAPDMWSMLHHIICKKRKDAKHKIAVNDSKQLKSNAKKKALTHLERGVFAFMNALGLESPEDDDAFLKLCIARKLWLRGMKHKHFYLLEMTSMYLK